MACVCVCVHVCVHAHLCTHVPLAMWTESVSNHFYDYLVRTKRKMLRVRPWGAWNWGILGAALFSLWLVPKIGQDM